MRHRTDVRFAATVAAYASLGAGLIHLAVTPGHWDEWTPSGVFFVGLAAFQVLWAGALLWSRNAAIMGLGVAVNAGSMALWAVSRMWGTPVGPNAGVPEAVDLPGVAAFVLQSVVVVSGLWFLLPRHQSAVLSTGGYRLGLGGVVVVLLALTAPGAIAGLEHEHGDHGHGDHGHDDGSHSPEQQEPDTPDGSSEPNPTTDGSSPSVEDDGATTSSPETPSDGGGEDSEPEPDDSHDDGHDHDH